MLAAAIPWENMGCEVCGVAYDGIKGMALLKEKRPDIIIADIRMPGMDGLQMLRCVRELLPDSRVIFMSAYDDFAFVQEALHLRADEYLLKPFENNQLTDCVWRLLKEMRGEDQEGPEPLPARTQLVNSILSYVNEHPDKHSLQDTAEHFGFSPAYISSLVKKETGENYMDWVTRARVKRAKEMLRDPQIRAEEVASALGYKNYISFYTMFVKWVGISPREWRNGGDGK